MQQRATLFAVALLALLASLPILFGLTGTGYFDMKAYDAFNRGEMADHEPTDEELAAGFATIPHIEGLQ